MGRQTRGGIQEFTGLRETKAADTDTADTACVDDRLTLCSSVTFEFFFLYISHQGTRVQQRHSISKV